jgi:outer membrane immunogenic protein
MQKSGLLAALALSLTFSATALADGYEPQGKVLAPPSAFSWTGFYVGGIASHAWADSKHCDDQSCAKPGVGYPAFDNDGWLGGFTVGYNHQVSNWVYGLELDWSWGDLSGSSPSTQNFGCAGICKTHIDWIGTVRGRMGYAFDHLLLYGTLGVALTHEHASIGSPVLASGGDTATSFVGGGGLEYAFTQHWSAKVEYLYIRDLDDLYYDRVGACGPFPTSSCFSRTGHIDQVRMGLNYRF